MPPYGYTDEQWATLAIPERGLLLAAWEAKKGVHEQPFGSNSGPEIDAYHQAAGSHPGDPWCAAFATYCLKKAGYTHFPASPASVHSWFSWAQANGKIVSTPQRGDLFVLLLSPTNGHMGFVVGASGGTYATIEGNSNDDGSREGYEVIRRTRSISAVTRFIRL